MTTFTPNLFFKMDSIQILWKLLIENLNTNPLFKRDCNCKPIQQNRNPIKQHGLESELVNQAIQSLKMNYKQDWSIKQINPAVPWAQFHQHSTYNFYARKSQKHKKTLMTQLYFLHFWDLWAQKLYVERWWVDTWLEVIICTFSRNSNNLFSIENFPS